MSTQTTTAQKPKRSWDAVLVTELSECKVYLARQDRFVGMFITFFNNEWISANSLDELRRLIEKVCNPSMVRVFLPSSVSFDQCLFSAKRYASYYEVHYGDGRNGRYRPDEVVELSEEEYQELLSLTKANSETWRLRIERQRALNRAVDRAMKPLDKIHEEAYERWRAAVRKIADKNRK